MLALRPRPARALLRLLPVLGWWAIVFCRPPAYNHPPRVVLRWVAQEPAEAISAQAYSRETTTWRWDLNSDEEFARWKPGAEGIMVRNTGSSLLVRASSEPPALDRATDFDASRVQVIRVHHSGLDRSAGATIDLLWMREGDEGFDPSRALTVVEPESLASEVKVYSFPVGNHRLWNGRIRQIRLLPTSVRTGVTRVFSVVALAREVDSQLLAEAQHRAWRVDLQGDVRSAVLAVPGHPIEREVVVPAHAELRTAAGVPPEVVDSVVFRIAVTQEGTKRTLRELRLDPSIPGTAGRWHEIRLGLDQFAGQRLQLALEAEVLESSDLRRGLPAWADPRLVAPGPPPATPNVVLVVIDTLRADRVTPGDQAERTSPEIDAWAGRDGITFSSAIAPAPWTLPSHVSLFTGLDALKHRINYNEAAPPSLHLLAERLGEVGYTTAAFTGGAYLSPEFGLDQGFSSFHYRRDPLARRAHVGKDLSEGLPRALAWLDADPPRPFFLFFHTYEVHAPYTGGDPSCDRLLSSLPRPLRVMTSSDPPDPLLGWRYTSRLQARYAAGSELVDLGPDGLELARRYYDCGVVRVDRAIGQLLRSLARRDFARDTLVILTSDHGEALGEKNIAGHYTLDDFVLRIPLIVSFPSRLGAGRTIDRQVRLIDAAATIFEAAGVEATGLDGRSLRHLVEHPNAPFPRTAESFAGSSNHGLSMRLDGRRKVILETSAWTPGYDRFTTYDLRADPDELSPVAATAEDRALAAELRRRFESSPPFLRARMQNLGRASFEARFSGPLAGIFRVKGFDIPVGAVTHNGTFVRAIVSPGEAYTLYFEGALAAMNLEVSALGGEGRAFAERLGPEDLDTGAVWSLTAEGTWRRAVGAPADNVAAIELRWLGPSDRVAATTEGELAETLRQLGYVN